MDATSRGDEGPIVAPRNEAEALCTGAKKSRRRGERKGRKQKDKTGAPLDDLGYVLLKRT